MAAVRRAPEKVFGLMDMRENLETFLPILTDLLDGAPPAAPRCRLRLLHSCLRMQRPCILL